MSKKYLYLNMIIDFCTYYDLYFDVEKHESNNVSIKISGLDFEIYEKRVYDYQDFWNKLKKEQPKMIKEWKEIKGDNYERV